jgi:hypothetical protein
VNQTDLDDLTTELFDEDLPNVVSAHFAGCGDSFSGSLSREHVETNEIVGIRSVFTAPSERFIGLHVDDPIWIGDEQYYARVIETRGVATTALILGK